MDSLTHTLLGACLGELIAGKKLGKKAMLFGILANNLPDFDMITTFWNSEAHSLLSHRGITHSIFFVSLATLLLSLLFQRIFPKYDISFKRWLLLIGSGLFLHIFLDACTAYGTGWFEPFSSYRVSFNVLFILDPFFMLPVLISTLVLLILKNSVYNARNVVNRIAIGLSIIYLICTIVIKFYVSYVVGEDLASKKIQQESYFVTPSPMNNLLWYTAAKSGETFYTGYYSIFDKEPTLDWGEFHKNDSLLSPYKNEQDVQDLKQFTKNMYCVFKGDSGLLFSDIRFGQLAGWHIKQAPFVFNFDILEGADHTVRVKQSEFEKVSREDLSKLVTRIKGK